MKNALLFLVMIICLTACGSSEQAEDEGATEAATESTSQADNGSEETEAAEADTEAEESSQAEAEPEKTDLIMATNGVHIEGTEKAMQELEEEKGYNIQIEAFDDIVQPNVALAEDSVDANFYQHKLYLNAYNEEHGTDLVPVDEAGIFALQVGLYSENYTSLDDFKEGDIILVGMDPSNRALGLKLLEEQGMIKLQEGVELPGVADITDNPIGLEFREMDATTIVTGIEDPGVAGGTMLGFAIARSGKDPDSALAYGSNDLIKENVMVCAVNREDKDSQWAQDLNDAYKTESMRNYYNEKFGNAIKFLDE